MLLTFPNVIIFIIEWFPSNSMFFLDDFLLNIDDLLHQFHLLQRMDFLEPTHFSVADVWLQRLRLRLMHVLDRPKLLDSVLQRLGKLSACGVHLRSCTLDGFALRVHWRLTSKVLSIRTIVLLCYYIGLSTRCCVFYLCVGRYWHLLHLLLPSVLLASVLEAVGKLLHGIKEAVLEAFLVLTRNGFRWSLFGELDELFFLLFLFWFEGARLLLESGLVPCAQWRLTLLFVDLTRSHYLGQSERILTK